MSGDPSIIGTAGIVEVQLSDGDYPIVLGRTFTLTPERARALAALLLVAARQIERDARRDARATARASANASSEGGSAVRRLTDHAEGR